MASEARRLETRRFQAAFAKLKADVVAVAARPEARPMRRLNMLRVLLMRLIDELDPPARGATALERDAIAEEEARWRRDGLFTTAEGGGGGGMAHAAAPARALVAVSPPGSPAQGGARRGVKRARAEGGDAAAAAAAAALRVPLPALLLVPIDSLPFAPTPSAPLDDSSPPPPLRLSKAATRMEIIPRDEFRWHPQYDATVADAAQAGNAAQRKYLRDLYAAMHRTKARGRAGEKRRLHAMLELGALETLQRSIAAAEKGGGATGDDGGAADGVIARMLPPALRGDGRAVAAVHARLALLSRSRQLLRAEHVALQLDSLERTEALEM
jgi:hypothetical protein